MSTRRNICFIASILPGKHDAFEGDFVLRHAEAISIKENVRVYFAIETPLVAEVTLEETRVHEHLSIYRYYLPEHFSKIWNKRKYYTYLFNLITQHHQQKAFHLIHANIHWRAGVLAMRLQKKLKISYVLSEHLGYLNQTYYGAESVSGYPFLKKYLSRKAFENAAYTLPVSRILGQWIQEFAPKTKTKIVSNTVNTKLFFYKPKLENTRFRFVHASMLYTEKNWMKILDAILLLSKKDTSFEFYFYAPKLKFIDDFIATHHLEGIIVQCGLVAHQEMPTIFQNAHCNVLYSTSETQGIVVLESLCCGIPNIGSTIPAISENINNTNGLLGNPESAEDLAYCMLEMINNYGKYDFAKIAGDAAAKWSDENIAKEFGKVYDEVEQRN